MHSSISKIKKVKEEIGFLHREQKQVTPLRYLLGLLIVERFLCSCMTPPRCCLGLLVVEQHQR